MRLSATATEYIEVPVTVDEDPTGSTPAIAIVDVWARPTDGDYRAAEWKDGEADPYVVRLLVGPDGGELELDPGAWYRVHLRITDNPEIPDREAGLIFVP